MRDISLDSITVDALLGLQEAGVREGRELEFKRDLPGRSEADKKELIADVSSFANTAGGDIVWGADEERDEAGKKTGRLGSLVGVSASGLDEEQQRLENILRTGVDPRLPGLRFRIVDGGASGPLIILRVPRSWIGPHMLRESGKIYMRNSNGKYQLDMREIRSAILESDSAKTRAQQFRRERIAKITSGDTLLRGQGFRSWALHIVPIGYQPGSVDILPGVAKEDLKPIRASGWSVRHNLDGLVAIADAATRVTQLFRDGAIEGIDASIISNTTKRIPTRVDDLIVQYARDYVGVLRRAGVDSPLAVFVSLIGVKGLRVGAVDTFGDDDDSAGGFDRDDILIPEVLVEGDQVTAEDLRPALDVLWQAAGHERCKRYDAAGNWLPKEDG